MIQSHFLTLLLLLPNLTPIRVYFQNRLTEGPKMGAFGKVNPSKVFNSFKLLFLKVKVVTMMEKVNIRRHHQSMKRKTTKHILIKKTY